MRSTGQNPFLIMVLYTQLVAVGLAYAAYAAVLSAHESQMAVQVMDIVGFFCHIHRSSSTADEARRRVMTGNSLVRS